MVCNNLQAKIRNLLQKTAITWFAIFQVNHVIFLFFIFSRLLSNNNLR